MINKICPGVELSGKVLVSESDSKPDYLLVKLQINDFTYSVEEGEHKYLIIEDPKINSELFTVQNGKLSLKSETPLQPNCYYGTDRDGRLGWHPSLKSGMASVYEGDENPGYLVDKLLFLDGFSVNYDPGNPPLRLTILTDKSITIDEERCIVCLVNDIFEFDANDYGKIYSTNSEGVKGWYPFLMSDKVKNTENSPEAKYLAYQFIGEDGILITSSKDEETMCYSVLFISFTAASVGVTNGLLSLVGDIQYPQPLMFYGTDTAGRKGWYKILASELNDEKVKITVDDIEAGYLNQKIISSTTVYVKNLGDKIQLSPIIADEGKVRLNKADPVMSFLSDKVKPGRCIEARILYKGGDEKYQFSLSDECIASDELVKVAVIDYRSGYLYDKVRGGEGIYIDYETYSDGYQTLIVGLKVTDSLEIKDGLLTLRGAYLDEVCLNMYYGSSGKDERGWYTFPIYDIVSVSGNDLVAGYLIEKLLINEPLTVVEEFDLRQVTKDLRLLYSYLVLGLNVENSIYLNDNVIMLVGDVDFPGPNKYYGTNDEGVKGWWDLPDSTSVKVDATDLYPSSLYDKIDASGGFVIYPSEDDKLIFTVATGGSITVVGNSLGLVGDLPDSSLKAIAEVSKMGVAYYGTDESGKRTWLPLPDFGVLCIKEDSEPRYLVDIFDSEIISIVVQKVSPRDEVIHFTLRIDTMFLELTPDGLRLKNDQDCPEPYTYYGMDRNGHLGWHSITNIIATYTVKVSGNDEPGYLASKFYFLDGVSSKVIRTANGAQLLQIELDPVEAFMNANAVKMI